MYKKIKISLFVLVGLFIVDFLLYVATNTNKIRCGGGLGSCMENAEFQKIYGNSPMVQVNSVSSIAVSVLLLLIIINIVLLIIYKYRKNKVLR